MEQIAPYDEALTVSEYQVRELVAGPESSPGTGEKIRVAHWAVVSGKSQPLPDPGDRDHPLQMKLVPLSSIRGLDRIYRRNDLPFDAEESLYLDLSQSLATPDAPELVRYDYRGPISRRMQIYWMTRHQLRLAVIGNSHAGVGVDPRLFFQPENESVPAALNLCVPGSELPLQRRIVEEYLLDLPRLEWIVWGVSPRIFNENHAFDRRDEIFRSSPGHSWDQAHHDRLWPVNPDLPAVGPDAIREAIYRKIELWGWSPTAEREYPDPLTADAEDRILSNCRRINFDWNEAAWTSFAETVRSISARGIRLLLFTPPYHPLVRRGNTADFNGTGHDDYRKIVSRIRDLADSQPGVSFLDIHRDGDHDFIPGDFANPDHLHSSGAEKLTRQLVESIESVPPTSLLMRDLPTP